MYSQRITALREQFDYVFKNDYTEESKNKLLQVIRNVLKDRR